MKFSAFALAASLLALPATVSSKVVVGIYGQEGLNGGGKGDCSDETWNLESIVQHFIATEGGSGGKFEGFSVDKSLIKSFSDAELATKIKTYTFFLIPDMERSITGWDARAKGIMETYVAEGGNLVMTGTHGTPDTDFLNAVFPGWDVKTIDCYSGGVAPTQAIDAKAKMGTPWEGYTSSLGCPNASQRINCGSVACTAIWGTPSEASVAVLPYKKGLVIYLGFDFYNTGYKGYGHVSSDCGQAKDPYVTEAFKGSLLFAKALSTGETTFGGGTAAPATAAPEGGGTRVITGGITGDPHVKLWNGDMFDFHGGCDLVVASVPDFANGLGLDVHIRTSIRTWWSYIETAVVRIGSDTFEVKGGKNTASYWINGVEGELGADGDLEHTIGGFKVHYRNHSQKQKDFRIDLGHGDWVTFQTFNDFVRVDLKASKTGSKFEGAVGLMGRFPNGEMVDREGQVVKDTNEFGKEWQVRVNEPKLFHTIEGVQHPEECRMPDLTEARKKRRLGEVMITEDEAHLACARVSPEEHDLCVSDVLATNNKDMAGAY